MIRKKNLAPSLLNWVQNTLQLGPGVGDVFYLAPSITNVQYKWAKLQGIPGDHMFTSLAAAYAACTALQNDVILSAVGDYVLTAEQDLNKDMTHIIGLGGPCVQGDYTQGGVNFYTATASVVNTFDIIADNCQFHNFKVSNVGANAANLSAVFLEGQANLFKNINIMGIMSTAQIASANPHSLGIGYGGYFPTFEDCIIGTNTWGPRTQTASGHLKFTGAGVGTYPPDGGIFRRCLFLSYAETASIAAIYLPTTQCIDRIWTFDRCHFSNFWVNADTLEAYVIDDNCGYTHRHALIDCTADGYTEWQTDDGSPRRVVANMPITGLGGGLMRQPTAAVGS